MNIVTKSGTNELRGSWFTLMRDTAMNAKTETEKITESEKQDYSRWQYGGSFGGPIVQNKAHFFGAYERTQQDTLQVVDTLGLFPSEDGIFATPYRETLLTVKGTMNLNAAQLPHGALRPERELAAVRSRPADAGRAAGATSANSFNSFNLNHNWVLGGSKLNEIVFQYADFSNAISANSTDPLQTFPNGVAVGQNVNTPQTTQQKKWQFRDDFSWSVQGMGGIGHDMKAGFNYIHEPTLFITFNTGTNDYAYTHLDNNLNGPLSAVTRNGGAAEANIPLNQYAFYVQDDWRVNNRLTLNLGLRYDLIDGLQIDQSKNPNFVKVQAAGAAGLLTGIKGLENAGLEPKEDTNNWQPRVGFAYDLRGDARDVIRGGWGIYQDVGYTNSNVLFPAIDATGIGSGSVFNVDNADGIRNPDGSFYQVGQPISNIASQNQANPNALPLIGQWVDPAPADAVHAADRVRLVAPGELQLGASTWTSSATTGATSTCGRGINTRPVGQPTAPRRLAFLDLQPNAAGTRPAISGGKSEYTALIMGFKRRMYNGFDFSASYTLAEAKSTIGTAGDELNSNNLQEAELLYDDPRVFGPTSRTDARHTVSVAMVWQGPWGINVSPIFLARSALPVSITEGVDLNRNGENNDLPAKAYAFDGVGNAPKEIGDCETWNCGRGAARWQMNLRLAKSFRLPGTMRVEAIGEIFNLFNATNPAGFRTPRLLGTGEVRIRTSCSRPSTRATSRTPSSASGRSGSGLRSRPCDSERGVSRRARERGGPRER